MRIRHRFFELGHVSDFYLILQFSWGIGNLSCYRYFLVFHRGLKRESLGIVVYMFIKILGSYRVCSFSVIMEFSNLLERVEIR